MVISVITHKFNGVGFAYLTPGVLCNRTVAAQVWARQTPKCAHTLNCSGKQFSLAATRVTSALQVIL